MGQDNTPLIHKCFEKVMPPDDYVKAYNERYDAREQWPGLNRRGFDDERDMEDGGDQADGQAGHAGKEEVKAKGSVHLLFA